jgi:hypothetical protein
VCPTRHIPNTRSLHGPADAALVARMQEVGRDLLLAAAADLPPPASGPRRGCCCWPWRRRGRGGGGGPLLADDRGGGPAGGGNDEPQLLFGFHQPPWRSVDHLHMHCFLLPLKPCTAWKYKYSLNWITAEDLEAQLAAETAATAGGGKAAPGGKAAAPPRR